MTNAWAGLQSVWTETVAAMSTAWTVFASGAVSAWKGAQNFIAKGIVHLMGMLDSSVDVEGTLAVLQEDFQREQQTRQRETNQKLSGIETDRQRRQTEIEQQRTGTLDALEEDPGLHVPVLIGMKNISSPREDPARHASHQAGLVRAVEQGNRSARDGNGHR